MRWTGDRRRARFESEPTNYQITSALHELAAGQQALAEAMPQSFAHLSTETSGVKADVAGMRSDVEGLRSDLIQTEARLTSRIGDLQGVVQTLKADLPAHDADGHGHRNAA